jgi:hypothetical protein
MNAIQKELTGDSTYEAVYFAVERVVFAGKRPQEAEVKAWIKDHAEDVAAQVEGFLKEAVRRVHAPKPVVTEPTLSFKFKNNQIDLFVSDSGQSIAVADINSQRFGGDDTATLVYVERGHGLHSTEYNINNPSTWNWIKQWMQKGFASEGLTVGGEETSGRLQQAE